MGKKALRRIRCWCHHHRPRVTPKGAGRSEDGKAVSCQDGLVGDTHTLRAGWGLGFRAGVRGATGQPLRNLHISAGSQEPSQGSHMGSLPGAPGSSRFRDSERSRWPWVPTPGEPGTGCLQHAQIATQRSADWTRAHSFRV